MSRELKAFLIDTLYRCIWTFCEAFGATIVVGETVMDIHWKLGLSIATVATVGCLIKQIGKYAHEHIRAQGQEDDVIEYIGEIYDDDYDYSENECIDEEDVEEGDTE